jgi:tetratricopeptide (TPR) repeat protein
VSNDLLSLFTEINDRISLADAQSFAGSIQRRKGNSSMTLYHYDSCMSISTQRNYQLGVAKAEIGYGEYKERERKYLEYFDNYNRTLEITRSEQNRDIRLEILTLKKMAFADRYLTDYNKSLELFLKILQHYEIFGDEVKVADLYNNIASVYWDIENDEKALEYWKSAIDLAKKTKNRDASANAYQGINIYYRFYGKIDEAEKYCLLDLQMRKEVENIIGLIYSYKNIGRTFQHKGDLESAKKYLLEGLKYAKILGQELKLAWRNVQIGRLFNEMNQPSEAIPHFNIAIKIAQKIRVLREESLAYENLAVSFSKLGDRAYEAQKRFTSFVHFDTSIEVIII